MYSICIECTRTLISRVTLASYKARNSTYNDCHLRSALLHKTPSLHATSIPHGPMAVASRPALHEVVKKQPFLVIRYRRFRNSPHSWEVTSSPRVPFLTLKLCISSSANKPPYFFFAIRWRSLQALDFPYPPCRRFGLSFSPSSKIRQKCKTPKSKKILLLPLIPIGKKFGLGC